MVSNKYVAGFFDADGSAMLKWWKQDQHYCFTLQIEFSQHPTRAAVLQEINTSFPFGVLREKSGYLILTYTGAAALRLAEQIHKYSILKGEYLRYLITVYQTRRGRFSADEKYSLETERKAVRKSSNPRIANAPANKWFAGYVDGDGSLFVRWQADRHGSCFLAIDAADWDREGVDLISKVYGGAIRQKGNVVSYRLYLTKQHIERVLVPLAKHCITKAAQAQYIISALRRGKINRVDRDAIKVLNGTLVPATTN